MAGAVAVVDSAGQLSRRPTLSRVAMGAVLAGQLGAIGGGLLQKKEDSRQIFILIDGTKVAWAVPVKPEQFVDATQFAAKFNSAAKAAGVTSSQPAPIGSASSGVTEQLATKANLHAQGALSDEENAQAKASVLGGN